MASTSIGGIPVVAIGNANRQGTASITTLTTTTLDAANEACHMVGYLYWEDGGSHTVNTTGSSSLQWRTGACTFANGSTTVKVGLAAVDTATGPPTRASNAADVVTFDVNASFTGGGGGITTAAWQTSVPGSGTKTIANGDLVAFVVQMTARGGADSVVVSNIGSLATPTIPSVTDFTGAAYSAKAAIPNVVVVAADGARGYIYGGFVASVVTNQAWNNTSGTKEYGNIIRFPFPVTAYGIVAGVNFGGNCDLILYSDPLGTPSAERTISVDSNTVGTAATASDGKFPFSSSYSLLANTDYAVVAKPTSGTNVTMAYKTYNDSSHQNSELLGTNCYAINRNTGAFSAQNSSKDRFGIGLLVGAFEHGVWPTGHLGV